MNEQPSPSALITSGESNDEMSDDGGVNSAPNNDELYDEKADQRDESYVYQKLRLGSPTVEKPRNSDAVLSCPCCFQIVCMDCQKHQRYDDQYRAMFVMNIEVRWEKSLMLQGSDLVERSEHKVQAEDQKYYSVHCNNCQTQVAALDMKDEVYHFFGCLASA